MTIFETFWSKTVRRTQKQEATEKKFRMSERQRVRGTAVDSYFCESRANLVSNAVMPPFLQKLLSLENPFRAFRVFRGSLSPCHSSCFRLSKLINSDIVKKRAPMQGTLDKINTIKPIYILAALQSSRHRQSACPQTKPASLKQGRFPSPH